MQNGKAASEISPPNPIDIAAFDWVAKHDAGAPSQEEETAFENWLKADARHVGAYARAMAASQHLERASGLGSTFPARTTASVTELPAPRMTRRTAIAGTGGLLAASLVAGVTYSVARTRNLVETSKGEVRRIALAEGSAVTLNTSTEIRPDLGTALRQIDLLRGEALFDAAKDPSRPFVVRAGAIRVRAIGTSFAVRRHAGGDVGVSVTEGVVEVAHDKGPIIERLTAGRVARVDAAGALLANRLDPEAVDQATAWTDGRIDLNGLTLEQASEEFRRYSDFRIMIEDRSIADLKVAGVYSTSDPRGFAEGVALSLGLAAQPTTDGILLARQS